MDEVDIDTVTDIYKNNICICDKVYIYKDNIDNNIQQLIDYAKQHNKEIIYV